MSQQISSSKDVLHHIQTRAQKNEPWPRTANFASIVLKSEAWKQSHASASDWLADAASKTSHALNTFRRQVRVTEFLESQLPSRVSTLFDVDLPFGPLEILMRLHAISPQETTALLPKVLDGEITYQKMRELYQQAQSNPSAQYQGRRAFSARANQFEARAIECIYQYQEMFLGGLPCGTTIKFDSNTRGFPYGRADLLAIGPDFIDGFEVKLFGADDNKFVLIRTLEKIAFLSSFYRQTWLIYPKSEVEQESHQAFIASLGTHLIRLDLMSVGVAQLSEDTIHPPEIRVFPQPQHPLRGSLLRKYLMTA